MIVKILRLEGGIKSQLTSLHICPCRMWAGLSIR